MFSTLFRALVRESHLGEAAQVGSATIILKIVKEHGPLSKHSIWQMAEAAGVKSKTHTKQMLNWLKKHNKIRVICAPKGKEAAEAEDSQQKPRSRKRGYTPPPSDKEFVYVPVLPPRLFPSRSK